MKCIELLLLLRRKQWNVSTTYKATVKLNHVRKTGKHQVEKLNRSKALKSVFNRQERERFSEFSSPVKTTKKEKQ